jgi:hypothetical protein
VIFQDLIDRKNEFFVEFLNSIFRISMLCRNLINQFLYYLEKNRDPNDLNKYHFDYN